MPRVISGSARGRTLKTLGGRETRPTSDRVKEGWFSVLSARREFAGLRVLELYGGIGQLSIEALSRGAESAVIVERSAAARKVIAGNLERCGLPDRAELRGGDAAAALRALAAEGRRFDLIFIDPPYAELQNQLRRLLEAGLTEICAPFAYVMIEHETEGKAATHPDVLTSDVTELQPDRRCQYGRTLVDFYEAIIAGSLPE